jgi:homoserine kinase
MQDRIHQPYRASICPLLPRLLPLAGSHGILGAALSGAGPAVLVILANEGVLDGATAAIRLALEGTAEPELLLSRFLLNGASDGWEPLPA